MDIVEKQVEDITYKNIDFRTIGDNEFEEITLLSPDPYINEGQYGTSYKYEFKYGENEVSAFIPEYYKSSVYGKQFHEVMTQFKRGDILKIGKQTKKTKAGKDFRMFSVEQVGRDEHLAPMEFNPAKKQQEAKINLEVKNGGDITEVATTEKQFGMDDWEKEVTDAILEANKAQQLNEEQIIKLFEQNNIEKDRASEIYKHFF